MKHMIKLTVLLCMITPMPFMVQGQDSAKVEKTLLREVQFDAKIGLLSNQHSSLSSTLKSNGWPAPAKDLFTYGIAGKMIRGKFLFGFEYMGYFSDSEEQGNQQTSLRGYLVEPYIGYVLVRKNNFRLYPYLGVNSSFSSLKLNDLSPVNNFGEVWTASRREGTVGFNSYALDLGIHGERIFNIENGNWDCPQNTQYISIGFQFGYYMNLSENGNGYFGQRFADSPTFQMNGFYGKLTIGTGTRMRQLKWK